MRTRLGVAGAVVALSAALVLVTGCGGRACPTALLEGELTTAANGELVVTRVGEAVGARVDWSSTHDVVAIDGVIVLADRSGRIVAREGDHISMGGGYGSSDVFRPCGDMVVMPAN